MIPKNYYNFTQSQITTLPVGAITQVSVKINLKLNYEGIVKVNSLYQLELRQEGITDPPQNANKTEQVLFSNIFTILQNNVALTPVDGFLYLKLNTEFTINHHFLSRSITNFESTVINIHRAYLGGAVVTY